MKLKAIHRHFTQHLFCIIIYKLMSQNCKRFIHVMMIKDFLQRVLISTNDHSTYLHNDKYFKCFLHRKWLKIYIYFFNDPINLYVYFVTSQMRVRMKKYIKIYKRNKTRWNEMKWNGFVRPQIQYFIKN